jgi:hypothetical protein
VRAGVGVGVVCLTSLAAAAFAGTKQVGELLTSPGALLQRMRESEAPAVSAASAGRAGAAVPAGATTTAGAAVAGVRGPVSAAPSAAAVPARPLIQPMEPSLPMPTTTLTMSASALTLVVELPGLTSACAATRAGSGPCLLVAGIRGQGGGVGGGGGKAVRGVRAVPCAPRLLTQRDSLHATAMHGMLLESVIVFTCVPVCPCACPGVHALTCAVPRVFPFAPPTTSTVEQAWLRWSWT